MYFLLLALLAVASAVDLRRREIPDWIPVVVLAAAVGAKALGFHPVPAWQMAVGLVVGFAGPFALFALGGMGGGDVKLSAAVGAALGFPAVLVFLGLFFVFGAGLSLAGRALGARETAQAPAMFAALLALLAVVPLASLAS